MVSAFEDWSQSPPPTDEKLTQAARDQKDKPKKPRHRHSAWQLAALNELYEQNDHPPLAARTSLADRLGMEVKTVNAWFQNKRASTKKRNTKASSVSTTSQPSAPQYELPPIAALIASVSSPAPPATLQQDFDELSEDDHLSPFSDRDLSRIPYSSAEHHRQRQNSFFAGNPQQRHHIIESDHSMPHKARSRPTPSQTKELKAFYEHTSHPTKFQREELGQRIGMRYQSVTNWFQNQRSIAKKRKDDEDAHVEVSKSTEFDHSSSSSRTYSPFPPSSSTVHPSLAASVPPVAGHPSLPSVLHNLPRTRRAASVAPASTASHESRSSSPRISPYRIALGERANSVSNNRSRRTRPDSYQLDALKKLFHRTSTPSIEERGALALEINMDVNKVTNWFRNLRQATRKRSQRNPDDVDDLDFDDISLGAYTTNSRDISRAGSPFPSISTSPESPVSNEQEDGDVVMKDVQIPLYPEPDALKIKLEMEEKRQKMYANTPLSRSRSDMGSDEDDQEAVTPPSETSPLAPYARAVRPQRDPRPQVVHVPQNPISPPREYPLSIDPLTYAQLEKATAKFQTGVRVEDALLLLSFHHNVVR